MTDKEQKQRSHKKKMQKLKSSVDASIAAADAERGVSILLTGNGKGKSSSAFGMVIRTLGYSLRAGVVQFIKGEQLSGGNFTFGIGVPMLHSIKWARALLGIRKIGQEISQRL